LTQHYDPEACGSVSPENMVVSNSKSLQNMLMRPPVR